MTSERWYLSPAHGLDSRAGEPDRPRTGAVGAQVGLWTERLPRPWMRVAILAAGLPARAANCWRGR